MTRLVRGSRSRRSALAENRRAWEEWSEIDPLWSIVTFPDRRHGGWDVDEFFASGEATVTELLREASRLGLPKGHERALDFGCGVGRLTRALGAHVNHVLGLDISEGMIDLARSYNAAHPQLEFAVHRGGDLRRFPEGAFDVVCCLLVLQHIPAIDITETYLRELVRVLAPGGVLMLQLMHDVPPPPAPAKGIRARLRPRTRLARALHAVGANPRVLGERFAWEPAMPVVAIGEDRASQLVRRSGGEIVWRLPREEDGYRDALYLVTR